MKADFQEAAIMLGFQFRILVEILTEARLTQGSASQHLATTTPLTGHDDEANPWFYFGYFNGYFKRKQGLKQDILTDLLDSATL